MSKTVSFKIRNRATGLFSTGGTTPGFTKNGKSWSSMGALKNHLRWVNQPMYNYMTRKIERLPGYDKNIHEIIRLEITETTIGPDEFQDVCYGRDKL